MHILLRFFMSVIAACVFYAALAGDTASGNVVGYIAGGKIGKGNNTYTLPPKPDGSPITVSDFLGGSGGGSGTGLIVGDRVLVTDECGNEEWGTVGEEGDDFRIVSDNGADLSRWQFPALGGDQVLKIKRTENITTEVVLSGEFDIDQPLQTPVYFSDAPLSKIRIDPGTAKKIQAQNTVTVTNRVTVPFPTSVPRKFLVILKDGRQLTVMVDLDTRLIVDAVTHKPVSVATRDIERFSEITDATVPSNEKMTKGEIKDIARDVVRQDRSYNLKAVLQEGIIGVAWDKDHPCYSIICWFLIVGVLAFANKIWEDLFGFAGTLYRRQSRSQSRRKPKRYKRR